jgi:hypothetical protein
MNAEAFLRTTLTAQRIKCQECGDEIDFRFSNYRELQERRVCFSCNFWLKRVTELQSGDKRYLSLGGVFHSVATFGFLNRGNPEWRGYAGRRWRITYLDGSEETTDDLWCRGRIPDRFKDRLKDNIKSLKEDR